MTPTSAPEATTSLMSSFFGAPSQTYDPPTHRAHVDTEPSTQAANPHHDDVASHQRDENVSLESVVDPYSSPARPDYVPARQQSSSPPVHMHDEYSMSASYLDNVASHVTSSQASASSNDHHHDHAAVHAPIASQHEYQSVTDVPIVTYVLEGILPRDHAQLLTAQLQDQTTACDVL